MSNVGPSAEEQAIRAALDQPWIDLRDPSAMERVSNSLAGTVRPEIDRELVPASGSGRPLAQRSRRN